MNRPETDQDPANGGPQSAVNATRMKNKFKFNNNTQAKLYSSVFLLTLTALTISQNVAYSLYYQQYPNNGFSITGNNLLLNQHPLQSLQMQSQQQPQQQLPPIDQLQLPQQAQQQQQQQQQSLSQDLHILNNQTPNDQFPASQLAPNQQPSQHSGRSAIERDNPIFRFHGIAQNSTSVKLVWNLLKGYQVEYFNIEWGPLPDAPNAFSIEKLNGSARDYYIHQLQPDTLYQFQLQVHGDHIHRPQLVAIRTPSSMQTIKTQDYINNNKEIMPLGVKAEAKSNNSIQLSWLEPDRPASIKSSSRVNIIRYYIVPSLLNNNQQTMLNDSYSSQSSPASQSSSGAAAANSPQYHYLNVTNARESRLIVQRLKPATEYAFAVKTAYYTPDLRRILSQSGFSMDTSAKTFDLEPSAPRNFSIQLLPQTKEELQAGKLGRLELSWSPPESPNGQLKGYYILLAHEPNAPEEQWKRIEVNGANINNWFVSNILHGYSYYFKIRAINQRGQSGDSETRLYVAPMPSTPAQRDKVNMPIPVNNVYLIIMIFLLLILFLLVLVFTRLACGSRRAKHQRKGSLTTNNPNDKKLLSNGGANLGLDATVAQLNGSNVPKLNGFASINSSSTVAGRVGTLARRTNQVNGGQNKQDLWISAIDQHPDSKSNISEKSQSELNMAMVSIQRDSPQFATTQLAPALPEYRFDQQQQHLINQLQQQHQQQQQQSHYHPGQFTGTLGYDQMDNATASALMTLSKRQQQQMQKYQIQFASTGVGGTMINSNGHGGNQPTQAPSPHQQPPPPPPLNIEQQQQQQSLYGTHHQTMANTRSLRHHRPTLYDPVSCSFLQGATSAELNGGPPNYNQSHNYNQMQTLASTMANNNNTNGTNLGQQQQSSFAMNSNTLQFYPHQTSTLLSRRSTNTLRSFQTGANSTYGQLAGVGQAPNFNQIGSIGGGNAQQQQQPQQLLQTHQAVINQLNNSGAANNQANNFPSSLPLKHVSAVRPQIMSSLEDQIELELAEKEQQQPITQQQATN